MFNSFLKFLEKHDRKRIIYDRNGEKYLTRYYLFLKDRKNFPFNIFLHNFHISDPHDLHCHPWMFFRFILKGGYWEWVPIFTNFDPQAALDGRPVICGERKVWRGVGYFSFNKAEDYHRIELESGIDCWSLFIPGPQKREWGFLTHKNWDWRTFKWVQHSQYNTMKKDNNE